MIRAGQGGIVPTPTCIYTSGNIAGDLGGCCAERRSNSKHSGHTGAKPGDQIGENDVAAVNSALALYEVNGGTIPAGTHPTNIVTILKQSATAESAAENQVASGSFVDLRLRAIMMNGNEISSSRPRAVFDTNSSRFVIQTNGVRGVREFRLDEVENVAAVARTGDRQLGTNGRVWNYDTNGLSTPTATPRATPILVAAASGGLQKLAPPTFSPAGGHLPLIDFQPLIEVTISNPNNGGRLLFAGNGGGRQEYSAALQVSPGAQVTAWVESDDPARWINSDVRTAQFDAQPHPLELSWNAPSTVDSGLLTSVNLP